MTSILKVTEIQDPTNSNTALTIDSNGLVIAAKQPYVLSDKFKLLALDRMLYSKCLCEDSFWNSGRLDTSLLLEHHKYKIYNATGCWLVFIWWHSQSSISNRLNFVALNIQKTFYTIWQLINVTNSNHTSDFLMVSMQCLLVIQLWLKQYVEVYFQ